MEICFDTNGNDKQKLVASYWIDNITEDIVYGGSKGSGKSYLGCSLIFGDAFIYPDTHYFIARKELTDLRKYTIPSIHEVFSHWGINQAYYSYNGQDNYFSLYNKSRVYLISAPTLPSDPQFQRFGSMQMTRGWIEESGEFEEAAKNGLAVSIGRWKNDVYNLKGKLLQTCNPSKNYLYRNYYQPNKQGILPERIKFVQALPQDNKKLPDGYLQMLHNTLRGAEKQRLLFGEWEYDSDPATLIDYEKILNCFTNDFENLKGEKYITVDLARLGGDKIICCVWDGWRCKITYWQRERLNVSGGRIEEIRKANGIPKSNVLCDDDGLGGGVVDYEGYKGFVNNSSPLPNPLKPMEEENYNNLKSQCYFRLADRINNGGLYIECEDESIKQMIIQELEQVKQHNMDKDGKKQVLPKDKVKEVLGRSPDFADTLMMREWFELKPHFGLRVW